MGQLLLAAWTSAGCGSDDVGVATGLAAIGVGLAVAVPQHGAYGGVLGGAGLRSGLHASRLFQWQRAYVGAGVQPRRQQNGYNSLAANIHDDFLARPSKPVSFDRRVFFGFGALTVLHFTPYCDGIWPIRFEYSDMSISKWFGRKDNPKHTEARHVVGVVAMQRDELEQAEPDFRGAIALADDCADYHNNLGSCLFRQ